MEPDFSLKDAMLKASTVLIASMVAGKALGYAYHFMFVRLFTQDQYGLFIYAWSMALFLCGLLIPNIPAAVTRYVAYRRGRSDEKGVRSATWTGIVINALFGIVAAVLFSLAYVTGLTGLDLAMFGFILAIMLLNSQSSLISAIIAGHRRPEVSSLFALVLQALRIAAVLLAAYIAASLGGLYLYTVAIFILFLAFLVAYGRSAFGFGGGFDYKLAKRMSIFGIYTVFYVTANNLLSLFSIFFIKYYMSAESVAVYNIASLASTVNLVFFYAVLQIFNPVVTELLGARKTKRAVFLTSYMLESFFLLFLPVFALTVVFAREILTIFFTAAYAEGTVPLQILAFGGFMTGVYLIFVELTAAGGRPQLNARAFGAGAAAQILLNVILVPLYGMVGAAIATVTSSTIIFLISYANVRTILRPSISGRRLVKIVLASVACIAIVLAVRHADMPIYATIAASAFLAAFAYASCIIALKALRKEDVSLADAVMEKSRLPEGIRGLVDRVLASGVQQVSP
ncbi:MAG: polysaccharide biosynthesis C-terminal domain-containing protein [Candidatus Altiarchaeota archaeon]